MKLIVIQQSLSTVALLLLSLLLPQWGNSSLLSPVCSERGGPEASEYITESGFFQSISLMDEQPIAIFQSKFQEIAIYRSKHYGKVLMLDGVIQLTERDANSYNEMVAHPAMFTHPNPKRVLVIGGGDGYVVSEVLKHPGVEHVDHVDLDRDVVDICRVHFDWGACWDDERVHLHIEDGAVFIQNKIGFYDVIIQDSSDPYTWNKDSGEKVQLPSETLYTREHFVNVWNALAHDGIFSFQAETFNIASDMESILEWRSRVLDVGFASAKYGSIYISSYPTGQIGFMLCEKDKRIQAEAALMKDIENRFQKMTERGIHTTYYHPALHAASFVLPLWVQNKLYDPQPLRAILSDA